MKVPNLLPEGVKNLEVARGRVASAENSVEAAKYDWKAAKRRRREAKENAFRAKKRFKRAKEELAEARVAFAEAERYQAVTPAVATAKKKTKSRVINPIVAKTRARKSRAHAAEAPASNKTADPTTENRERRTELEVESAVPVAPPSAETGSTSDFVISPEPAL
jgi:hypothetical protein